MDLNSSSPIQSKLILTVNTLSLEGNFVSPLQVSSRCRVIDGFDTLDLLEKVEVNHKHRPIKEVRLQNVTIHANPLAEENLSFS
jgi:hypothetical protein